MISKAGFIICIMCLVALVAFIGLQKEEIIVIPEFFGMLFLLLLLITMVSFVIALVIDVIQEARANRWSTVLGNLGLLGLVTAGLFLWDTRLLSVPINIVPWLYKTMLMACAVEACAYILSRKIP